MVTYFKRVTPIVTINLKPQCYSPCNCSDVIYVIIVMLLLVKGAITITEVCDDNAARKTDKGNKAGIP